MRRMREGWIRPGRIMSCRRRRSAGGIWPLCCPKNSDYEKSGHDCAGGSSDSRRRGGTKGGEVGRERLTLPGNLELETVGGRGKWRAEVLAKLAQKYGKKWAADSAANYLGI